MREGVFKRGPRPIDDLGAALDSDLAAAPWQCVLVDLRVLGTEPRAFATTTFFFLCTTESCTSPSITMRHASPT